MIDGSVVHVYHQPQSEPLDGKFIEMRDGDTIYRVHLYENSGRWGYPANARITYYPLYSNENRMIPESNLVRRSRVGGKSPKQRRAHSATSGGGSRGATQRKVRQKGPTKAAKRSLLPWQTKKRQVRRKAASTGIRQIRKYQGKCSIKIGLNEEGEKVEWKRYTMDDHATELLIKKAPFTRLVREICNDLKSDLRMTETALRALQEAAEAHVVSVFQDANLCAMHCGRETLKFTDMRVAGKIRRDAKVRNTSQKKWEKWMHKNPGCFVRMKPKSVLDTTGLAKSKEAEGLLRSDGVADSFW